MFGTDELNAASSLMASSGVYAGGPSGDPSLAPAPRPQSEPMTAWTGVYGGGPQAAPHVPTRFNNHHEKAAHQILLRHLPSLANAMTVGVTRRLP